MHDLDRRKIAELLSSADPGARRRAAEEMSDARGFAAVASLAAALRDENKGVRDAASRALLTIGGESVAHAVVEYLADPNIVTRNLAADLLVRLKDQSVQALLPTMYDGDEDVRKFAVDILGVIGARDAVPHLVRLLDDPDANVVVSAVEATGSIGDERAVPALITTYEMRDDAKAAVVEALGKIGGSEAAQFLGRAFERFLGAPLTDPVQLYTFLEAFGAVGDASTIAVLRAQVPRISGPARSMLLHSLVRLTERCGLPLGPMDEFRDALLEALADDDAAIRISAARALSTIPGDAVTRALLAGMGFDERLDAVLTEVVEARPNLFVAVIALLESGDARPGRQLIGLLSRYAAGIQYDDLPGEFMDAGIDLLARACAVLRNAWPEANEETRGAIVDALFRLDGDQAILFLDQIMNDPDPWLRMHTIELLAPLDDRRIPQFIARFLTDDDEMVREVAVATLDAKGFTVESTSGN